MRNWSNRVAGQGYSLCLSLLLEQVLCLHWYISRFIVVKTLELGLLSYLRFPPLLSLLYLFLPIWGTGEVIEQEQVCLNVFWN